MDKVETEAATPNLATKELHPNPEHGLRLSDAVLALQSGDRQRSHEMFASLAGEQQRDENVWIGLALSSDDPAEARGAVRRAELINPGSMFVQRAAADVAQRFPAEQAEGGASRGSVDAAPEAEPEPAAPPAVNELSSGPVVLAGKPSRRPGRFFASLGLLILVGSLVSLVVAGLANSDVIRPAAPPTSTPTATPLPPLPPPQIFIPPQITPTTADISILAAAAPVEAADAARRQEAIQAVREGRFSTAIEELELAAARDPRDAEAHYYLGLAYMGAPARPDGVEEAILAFRSLVALLPDWAPGYYVLARTYIAQARAADAVPAAQRAVEIDPGKAEYWMALAEAYDGSGSRREAAEARAEAERHSSGLEIIPPAEDSGAGVLAAEPMEPLLPTETPAAMIAAIQPATPAPAVRPIPSGVPEETPPVDSDLVPSATAVAAGIATAGPDSGASQAGTPEAEIMQIGTPPAGPAETPTSPPNPPETPTK